MCEMCDRRKVWPKMTFHQWMMQTGLTEKEAEEHVSVVLGVAVRVRQDEHQRWQVEVILGHD